MQNHFKFDVTIKKNHGFKYSFKSLGWKININYKIITVLHQQSLVYYH